MARRKAKTDSEFVSLDVLYEDGSRRSSRRVPGSALGGLDGDASARAIIEAQDREFGRISNRPRPRIKSMTRSLTG